MSTVSSYVDDVRLPQLEVGRNESLLWGVVAIVLVGDIATTMVGLRLGLVETNPVAVSAIEISGLWGMTILKLWAVGVGLAARTRVPKGYESIVPIALSIPWTIAVSINLYWLITLY